MARSYGIVTEPQIAAEEGREEGWKIMKKDRGESVNEKEERVGRCRGWRGVYSISLGDALY